MAGKICRITVELEEQCNINHYKQEIMKVTLPSLISIKTEEIFKGC